MAGWIVVTGAGTGLGKAIALLFAGKGYPVLGVGRRLEPLERLRSQNPTNINVVSADVSKAEGREAIRAALPASVNVKYLIHNAGVLQPVKLLVEIGEEGIKRICNLTTFFVFSFSLPT